MKGTKSSCEGCISKLVHSRKHADGQLLDCHTCKRSFSNHSSRLKNTGDKKHVCHVCKRRFLKKVYLNQHLRTHTGERPYICEVCLKGFVTKGALNVHCLTHTGEKPHTCEICSKRFRHASTLKYHCECVHRGVEHQQLHICNTCSNSFKERKDLLSHELMHKKAPNHNLTQNNSSLVDSIEDSVHPCSSNDIPLRHQDYVKTQNDTQQESKPCVCHICQQCFSDEKSFRKHSNTHKNEVIPVVSSFYSCDVNSGKEIILQDYGSQVKENFICNICDEQFDDSDSLNTHFKTHTEQKYYVCEVCQLCFIDEDALRNHEDIEKCVYFHTCKICGEKFVCKDELETHCRTHDDFSKETDCSNSFNKLIDLGKQCSVPSNVNIKSSISEKYSASGDNRTEKVYSHVKDLSYNCELCKKNFTNENDFKQHNAIHTEKKSHACVLCLKNFDKRLDLDAHICKYDNNEKKPILFKALQGDQLKGYICSVCFKCFLHYHEFQHHMFDHDNDHDKDHECKTCGKRFFSEESLKTHCLQSHKPPLHPCIVCKEKFLNKKDLIAHCLSHLGSGEYFICGLCKQCFKGREDLQKHNPCFMKTETT